MYVHKWSLQIAIHMYVYAFQRISHYMVVSDANYHTQFPLNIQKFYLMVLAPSQTIDTTVEKLPINFINRTEVATAENHNCFLYNGIIVFSIVRTLTE